ncbi:hypothetical protein Tco_1449022 [Tanacetum coccineum]
MCELQQPTRCKSKRVKRKRFVKPKVVPVKSNVGKRKRLDEDVASEEVEDEDVVSDEDGDDVDECVSDEEGNDAAEGNDVDEHVSDEEEKESEEGKGSEEVDETNEAEEAVKKSTKEEKVSKPKKFSKKKQQFVSLPHPLKMRNKNKKKRVKQGKDVKNKMKKPPTLAQIKRDKYLSEFPRLHSRTVPCSVFAAIRDSQVDMKSFVSDFGFSSLHNVFIDTLPARLARFVVRAFRGSSYEFKLDKGIIRVTPEKVHEILGVPLSGTSIFDLPEIPLDDLFVKLWF